MTEDEIRSVNERSAEQGHRLRVDEGFIVERKSTKDYKSRNLPPVDPYTFWEDRLAAMSRRPGPVALWNEFASDRGTMEHD